MLRFIVDIIPSVPFQRVDPRWPLGVAYSPPSCGATTSYRSSCLLIRADDPPSTIDAPAPPSGAGTPPSPPILRTAGKVPGDGRSRRTSPGWLTDCHSDSRVGVAFAMDVQYVSGYSIVRPVFIADATFVLTSSSEDPSARTLHHVVRQSLQDGLHLRNAYSLAGLVAARVASPGGECPAE